RRWRKRCTRPPPTCASSTQRGSATRSASSSASSARPRCDPGRRHQEHGEHPFGSARPAIACPAVSDSLVIRGAREHNLRNVSLDLPREKLIVFTGLSGSGKSSLAFDTIYAEGQRRYVESLS